MVQDVVNSFFDIVSKWISVPLWIVVHITILFLAYRIWLYYRQGKYIQSIVWVLLEVRVPRDVKKTPKAMEQVFASLYASYTYGMHWKEKYIKGKVEDWFSWEVVGTAGGFATYVRTNVNHRHLVESAIYSQYPDAEITEVPDYVPSLEPDLPNDAFDLWGADMVLTRESAYPVRTYIAFEEKTEEAYIDPLGSLFETLSKLQKGEVMLMQLLIRPAGNGWKAEAEKIRDAVIGRKKPSKKGGGFLFVLGEFFENLVKAPFTAPTWTEPKKEEEKDSSDLLLKLTPGEREILKSIEEKMGKLGFESIFRIVFVDHRDSFSPQYITAVVGYFHQFNTQHLNAFKPWSLSFTSVKKGFFKPWRLLRRKRRIYRNYRNRYMYGRNSVLNIEELATIFHFPSYAVEAPALSRVPAKKGEAPPNLPLAE